jgi:hypothetical protein
VNANKTEIRLMGIERAHTLIATIGADTLKDLCGELREMATKLERGEMTVGCLGGPSVGTTYSYRVRPEQTHEKYFQDIEAWLEEERRNAADSVPVQTEK